MNKDILNIIQNLDKAEKLASKAVIEQVRKLTEINGKTQEDLKVLIKSYNTLREHYEGLPIKKEVEKISNELTKNVNKLAKSLEDKTTDNITTTEKRLAKKIYADLENMRKELVDEMSNDSKIKDLETKLTSEIETKTNIKTIKESLKLKIEDIEDFDEFKSNQVDYSPQLKDLRNSIAIVDGKIQKIPAGFEIFENGRNLGRFPSINFIGTVVPSASRVDVTLGGDSGASTFLGLTDTPSSYTGQALKVARVNAGETALEFITLAGGGDALTTDPLSQFAATTSAQLAGVISDETGTGELVFNVAPTIRDMVATNSLNLDYTTVSTIAIIDGSKNLISADTATYPSLTELTRLKGVTSAIQTQLDARILDTGDTITGTYNLTGQLNVDNLRLDGNTLSSTDTNGDINLTPNGTGMVVIPVGTTAIPGIAFAGDLDTGISKSSTANTGLLMAGGGDRFSWNTASFGGTSSNSAMLLRGLGSDSTPSIYNLSDTNTGLVLAGSDVLGLTTGGVRALTINASQVVAIPKLRATPRVTTITSSATPTVNTDDCEFVTITALAVAITSMTTNLSGTPANFQPLTYRIKDDGTARAITWGASFASRGGTLPTTTPLGKVLNVGFRWNSVASTWDCLVANVEA